MLCCPSCGMHDRMGAKLRVVCCERVESVDRSSGVQQVPSNTQAWAWPRRRSPKLSSKDRTERSRLLCMNEHVDLGIRSYDIVNLEATIDQG